LADLFDLTGKTALVTGAGGILGRGFCQVLAAHGARVAAADIDAAAAAATVEHVRTTTPGAEAFEVVCDVSNPESVEGMVASVVERSGGIDVLNSNAATKSEDHDAFFAPYEKYSLAEWRRITSVNLDGMFLVTQAVGRRMAESGRGGSIVLTASIYGSLAPDPRIYEGSLYMGRPINTPAVYSASKAAVIGLGRYLAAYWAPRGIRVNSLSPGGVDSGQNETFKQRYGQRVPLGRMAARDEMQGAMLFLASEASTYVTGQNLLVDGGLSCW
jgi:NAD(P)-dependent dehydrogenase (short-subunit alcohol dehydrogenase family)